MNQLTLPILLAAWLAAVFGIALRYTTQLGTVYCWHVVRGQHRCGSGLARYLPHCQSPWLLVLDRFAFATMLVWLLTRPAGGAVPVYRSFAYFIFFTGMLLIGAMLIYTAPSSEARLQRLGYIVLTVIEFIAITEASAVLVGS